MEFIKSLHGFRFAQVFLRSKYKLMEIASWARKLHVKVKSMPVIRNQSSFEFVMNLLDNSSLVLVREVWLSEHGSEFIKSL